MGNVQARGKEKRGDVLESGKCTGEGEREKRRCVRESEIERMMSGIVWEQGL